MEAKRYLLAPRLSLAVLAIAAGFVITPAGASTGQACRALLKSYFQKLNAQASAKSRKTNQVTMSIEYQMRANGRKVIGSRTISYKHNGKETYMLTSNKSPQPSTVEFYMNGRVRIMVSSLAKRIIIDSAYYDFSKESEVSNLVGSQMSQYIDSLRNLSCEESFTETHVGFEYPEGLRREMGIKNMAYSFDRRTGKITNLFTNYVPGAPLIWQRVTFISDADIESVRGSMNGIFPGGKLRPDLKNYVIIKK